MKDPITQAFTEHNWRQPVPKSLKYTRHPQVCRAEARNSLQSTSIKWHEAQAIVAELKAKGRIWWGTKQFQTPEAATPGEKAE